MAVETVMDLITIQIFPGLLLSLILNPFYYNKSAALCVRTVFFLISADMGGHLDLN